MITSGAAPTQKYAPRGIYHSGAAAKAYAPRNQKLERWRVKIQKKCAVDKLVEDYNDDYTQDQTQDQGEDWKRRCNDR